MSTATEALSVKDPPKPRLWRWVINLRGHGVELESRGGLTVMDFVRFGMSNAAPRFRCATTGNMEHAKLLARVVPGREHHAAWHQTIEHPDARLIASAPQLLAALKRAHAAMVLGMVPEKGSPVEMEARAAIEAAEGKL